MINHKLLCLFEGKCWHKWSWKPTTELNDLVYLCTLCGERTSDIPFLDYSSPNTYIPFLQWFWKGKREMWGRFLGWVYIKEHKPALSGMWKTGIFISWLFSLTPDNEPRIMVLLSEWLALPETREKWGWEECPECHNDGDYQCGYCKGHGRIKAEWQMIHLHQIKRRQQND